MNDTMAAVSAALDGLREGFNSDGADLEVVNVSAHAATVRLVITPSTCLECIVSKAVLQQIVENSVRQACPQVQTVELIDPREAASL